MEKVLYFAQKGLILNQAKTKILVSKFKSAVYLPQELTGKLCLPGGRLEHGESLERAFAREIQEEIGVTVSYGQPIYAWTWIYQKDDQLVQIVANAVMCEYVSGEITDNPVAPSKEIEYEKARWINLKDIKITEFVEDQQPAIRILLNS